MPYDPSADPVLLQKLAALQQNHQEQMAAQQQIHDQHVQGLVDNSANTMLQTHQMYGPSGVAGVALNYLHKAGPTGPQHLLAIARRLHQQGQVDTAAAVHDAMVDW